MQTLPVGAPAHAGGAAVVSEVLIGTVLHAAALVVLGVGYPVGMPPSEGGGGAPLEEAPPELEMPPLLEPPIPEELPKPPEPDPDAEDDREPEDDPDDDREPEDDPEDDREPEDDPDDAPVPEDDPADPEEPLLPPPGSVQKPLMHIAVPLLWQSSSVTHNCCSLGSQAPATHLIAELLMVSQHEDG